MRHLLILLGVLGLLRSALGATLREEFTARGKELLVNKAKLSDSDRLHRLFDFSWEHTMMAVPEFATAVGYPGQNDRWTDISFEVIARRKETNKLDHVLIKSIKRDKLPEADVISCDLVVDTGLHSMDWTREQALKYFEEKTGNPPYDIEVEVDRYIVWPSQALGDKIGQLKTRELRPFAEKEFGPKFDLRTFHDEVLQHGALPLNVLEAHTKEWVAKRKSA